MHYYSLSVLILALCAGFFGLSESSPNSSWRFSAKNHSNDVFEIDPDSYAAAPVVRGRRSSENGGEKPNYKLMGEDMVFAPGQSFSGINGDRYRWRKNVGFIVQIDSRFTQSEYDKIYAGLVEISRALRNCMPVKMWRRGSTPSGDYTFIQRGESGSGCWSYVGRQGGKQELNLQYNGCLSLGTIQHELYHALGFFHEQCRTDRDQFVTIHYENVQAGREHNFNIESDSTNFSPYDTQSVMHYSAYAFSSNGRATISSKTGSPIGARDDGKLTASDIQKLRAMYGCSA